jgi:hypothetical protein
MSDQPDVETCTFQHTTLTTDSRSCPWWNFNPQSQQEWLLTNGLDIVITGISQKANTDMRCLTKGIRSEKCVVRRFRHFANMYLHKPKVVQCSLLHT